MKWPLEYIIQGIGRRVECIISQFEQHIRAITGKSIGDGKRHSNILMKNILGENIYNIRYDSESSPKHLRKR